MKIFSYCLARSRQDLDLAVREVWELRETAKPDEMARHNTPPSEYLNLFCQVLGTFQL